MERNEDPMGNTQLQFDSCFFSSLRIDRREATILSRDIIIMKIQLPLPREENQQVSIFRPPQKQHCHNDTYLNFRHVQSSSLTQAPM